MAGQGATIREVAACLREAGWTILFVCVPNTPHVGVIPIPTSGIARQRYTDIVAVRGSTIRLVEVEISLNERVAEDIAARLSEQRSALQRPATWLEWSSRVRASTGAALPTTPEFECSLVVIKSFRGSSVRAEQLLRDAEVRVQTAAEVHSEAATARGSKG